MKTTNSQHIEVAANGARTLVRFNALTTKEIAECGTHRRAWKLKRAEARAPRRAFSLIELLVIIAIIAILASLLLPALAKAKGKGLDIACRNNLHQLQICRQLHTDDNNDLMPPNLIQPYALGFRNPEGSWDVGDDLHDLNTTNLQRGVLFPYNHSVGIYPCPSDKTTVTDRPTFPWARTYQWDDLLNCSYDGGPPPWFPDSRWMKRRSSQLVDPSPTGILPFADDITALSGGDASFVLKLKPPTDADEWSSLPGEQHGRAGNLAFADGHAEHFRWRWSRANYPANLISYGLKGADDRNDFQRVKDCFPKPSS